MAIDFSIQVRFLFLSRSNSSRFELIAIEFVNNSSRLQSILLAIDFVIRFYMKGFYKQRKKNAGISKLSSTKSKSKPKNAVSFGSLNYSDPLIILHQIIRYLPNSP
ncbi:hypothetical protein L6452_36453 [Arctium lappa]|uniref:Uncharacterized protein n=1 Tax=Arctium lappa TaxID=4217 RepID=A0ACB8Y9X1_ARCLA|nr:hypothetical protein L6452_36453 [Arctium lappa]